MSFIRTLISGFSSGKIRADALILMRSILGEYEIPVVVQEYLKDYTVEHFSILSTSDVPKVAILGLIHYHDLGTRNEGKGLLLQRIVEWLNFAETKNSNIIPNYCRDLIVERIIEHNDWCIATGAPVKQNLSDFLKQNGS